MTIRGAVVALSHADAFRKPIQVVQRALTYVRPSPADSWSVRNAFLPRPRVWEISR